MALIASVAVAPLLSTLIQSFLVVWRLLFIVASGILNSFLESERGKEAITKMKSPKIER